MIYAFTQVTILYVARYCTHWINRCVNMLPDKMRYINTHTHTQLHTHTRGRGEEGDPTWLEHTLEIKDDQNKGSQTGGKNHPAYPVHPHQFAQSLFHFGTERGWRRLAAARFVLLWEKRKAGLSEAPGALAWY